LKNHSDDENHESASSTHLPQLRQWIENYEEAVTNHYSPELRARISSIRVNGAHTDLSVQFDPSVHKCRVHTQPLTELKYLVSTVHLPPNSPVIELRGKYMLSAQHRNSGSTFNTRQHAQRPGPFLFFYRLHKDNTEVCVDTRTYGNSARFIRRSCKPNAELRHSIVKGVLHLYIVTIANVEKNVELTIKHESHDLAAIGTTHIACACGNIDECTVNRTTIKKNGDSTDLHKKRRGRRTTSMSLSSEPEIPPTKPKKESIVQPPASPVASVKPEEEEEEEEEIKTEPEEAVKSEPEEVKPEVKEEVIEPVEEKPLPDVKEVKVKEEEVKVTPPPSTTPPIATRRSSSHHKVEKEEVKEPEVKEGKLGDRFTIFPQFNLECSPPTEKNKNKKLSREERKLEAILRAIAQMEKADQRKQEHQAKQAHRRESEPGPGKDEDKVEPKLKRKRFVKIGRFKKCVFLLGMFQAKR
jgi:histone-lysine N-methyltransferase MLL5